MVQFAIDPGRTALVIVDMRNCFVAGSPLAAPAGEQVARRPSQRAACRGARIAVVQTRHAVRPDRSNTRLGTDLEVILRPRGFDTLIVGGINTNVGVNTTAREAAVHELGTVFLSDGTANFDLPDGGLGPGQRGRGAPRRVRRDGIRLRPDCHGRPDARPDPGSGHRLSGILAAILALPIQEL